MAEISGPEDGLGDVPFEGGVEARDAGAAASLHALSSWRAAHAGKLGSPCANCGIALAGPFCLACGQSAEDFERTMGSLVAEALESLLHADARLWRTLGSLIVRPGALTRNYLAGRRAAQTPPLRLFLVVVLLFFLAGSLATSGRPAFVWLKQDSHASTMTLSPGAGPLIQSVAAWVNPRVDYATTHQREMNMAVESQLHQIAILFLPISTLLLGLLFAFRRGVFMFDHAIFSMHSLSFMGLLFSVVTVLYMFGSLRGLAGLLALAAPVHLFFHLRSVYATSVLGTLIRMLLLLVFSAVAVAVLLLGDVAFGLNQMGQASIG